MAERLSVAATDMVQEIQVTISVRPTTTLHGPDQEERFEVYRELPISQQSLDIVSQ